MDEQKYKSDLWSQIKDSYKKVVYTYVTHQKSLWLKSLKRDIIGWLQIVLTAMSTVGFLSIIITNKNMLAWMAGACSVISLALNLYSRSANMGEVVLEERKTVDALWPIVQDYLSLLTDFWYQDGVEEIKDKRKDLQDKTETVYNDAPRTGWLAYQLAKKALKTDGEQSFEGNEGDNLLPENFVTAN